MADEPSQNLTPKKRRRATWEKAFLSTLAKNGNVTASAEAAGLSRRTAYEHAERHPDFAKAWEEALEEAADVLELEARRRAHVGVEEPVFYQGAECGRVRKYSDTLLMFLLKGQRPEKFRDNASLELTGKGGGPIKGTVSLDVTDELKEYASAFVTFVESCLGEGGTALPPDGAEQPVDTPQAHP